MLQDPAATSELCGFCGGGAPGRRRRLDVDLVAGPTTGRRHPRVRDRPPAGDAGDLRRGGRVRRRPAARVPARLQDPARRARPPRRRHPDHRAARCWRCSRPSRRPAARSSSAPSSWTGRAASSTLRSPSTGRVYPLRALWQLELPTYEPGAGDLPAMRGRRARGQAREQRHRPGTRGAPALGRAPRAAARCAASPACLSLLGAAACSPRRPTTPGPVGTASLSVPASGTPRRRTSPVTGF